MSTNKASRVPDRLLGPNQSLPVWIFLILKMQKKGLFHSYLPCWARPKSTTGRRAIDKNVTETVVGITLSMRRYGGDSQNAMLSRLVGIRRRMVGIMRRLVGIRPKKICHILQWIFFHFKVMLIFINHWCILVTYWQKLLSFTCNTEAFPFYDFLFTWSVNN